jgi:hypothetical protein
MVRAIRPPIVLGGCLSVLYVRKPKWRAGAVNVSSAIATACAFTLASDHLLHPCTEHRFRTDVSFVKHEHTSVTMPHAPLSCLTEKRIDLQQRIECIQTSNMIRIHTSVATNELPTIATNAAVVVVVHSTDFCGAVDVDVYVPIRADGGVFFQKKPGPPSRKPCIDCIPDVCAFWRRHLRLASP